MKKRTIYILIIVFILVVSMYISIIYNQNRIINYKNDVNNVIEYWNGYQQGVLDSKLDSFNLKIKDY